MKHLGDLVLYCVAMGRQMAEADVTDAEAAQKGKKRYLIHRDFNAL